MATLRDKLLRKIGVSQKLFTKADWKAASAKAEAKGKDTTEILVASKKISPEQLRGLERAVTYRIGRDEDKALAKVIVDSGYADDATVEAALEEQKNVYSKTGDLARLCDLLVTGGSLSESQHLAARKIHDIARLAAEAERAEGEPDERSD